MKKKDQTNPGRKILQSIQKRERERPVGWGPVSAIVVTLGIYFGSQILAGYLIIQYLLMKGVGLDDIDSTITESVPLQFFFILLAEAAALALLWWFLRRRKITWSRIGIKKPSLGNILYAIPAYVVYFAFLLVAFIFLKQFVPDVDVEQTQQIGFEAASGALALSLVFTALVIMPALVEEIMIRGFLFGGLRNRFSFLPAALITSIVFGLAHLQLGSGTSPLWIAAVDTFILSIVLVWLREKTGNIWAGVVVHLAKNSLAFMTIFIFTTA
ncbi:MAG TPA: CPBP family intramembrane glutamic endopeptidase [Candidatus Saccharimonadales bacterium]|nr:CPBP family intramembrane glutamic endopeptidase [Candidatus Saccharimonadales bacterium]